MPVTPFHMGPGILIKAILQGFFSLIIFGWAQILMDLQPLFVIITGQGNLHGFSHTYIGATLIALISAFTGKWIYEMVMVFIKSDFTEYQKKLFDVPKKLTTGVCIVSAFIGTYSHVLLDSIMHSDVEPFYPINLENNLHFILSIENLYKLCVYTGIVGSLIYFLIRYTRLKK
ncbi:MAG: DUF4184 family protein [Bacteroidetes bacterium]|nr:DUF4184 family protein [Bacteroidota bacterium]